jgi:hypothetical protein
MTQDQYLLARAARVRYNRIGRICEKARVPKVTRSEARRLEALCNEAYDTYIATVKRCDHRYPNGRLAFDYKHGTYLHRCRICDDWVDPNW